MRINFDFLDLETFLAVKETASFQAAAERLNLSQSSVTRRIQKLEQELGTDLFVRTTRHVRPTLAAKRLQLRAEAILHDAQQATRALRDENEHYAYQRSQIITLATIPTVISGLVLPAMRAFQAAGQSARIRIMDLAANQVAEAVAQGDADVGVCSIPMLEPVTDFQPLFADPIVLVARCDDRLAKKSKLTWQDLTGETLILPARGTGNRLLIDEALAKNDSSLRWSYEMGRSSTALELVSNGFGVALLPKMAIDGPYATFVVAKHLAHPAITRSIGLVSRIGQADTPAVLALKHALMNQYRP